MSGVWLLLFGEFKASIECVTNKFVDLLFCQKIATAAAATDPLAAHEQFVQLTASPLNPDLVNQLTLQIK